MVSKKAKGRTAREEGKEGESQNDNNGGGGYEKIRDETIKANMEKMEKLGVIDLSRKLKSQIHPLKPKIPSPKNPTLPPSAPSRRSSRLADSELALKKRDDKAGKEAVTGPDKPKRPASAFFVFMEDFRKQHKKKHPDNKSVSVVGKKWKSMSDAEKAPFVAKAEKRKVEYEKNMQAYKNKQAEGNDAADEEESVKSMVVTDPDKPKRPGSTFFVFMEDFRKQHKEKHPDNKSVSVVGKAAGDKWKSMSDAEKAPFVAKAEKRKVEYEKNMQAYKNKQAEGNDAADEEESVKSKSEVHDDEDDSGEEDDGDDE